MLAFGLGRLKLTPQTFWSLSLPEWRAHLASVTPSAQPMQRAELQSLMQQYPDD